MACHGVANSSNYNLALQSSTDPCLNLCLYFAKYREYTETAFSFFAWAKEKCVLEWRIAAQNDP